MMWRIACVLCLVLFALPSRANATDSQDVVFSIEFSGFQGGSALDWLGTKGFAAKQDAGNAGKIAISIVDDMLVLEAKKRALGLLFNETDMPDATRIRIEWGVDAFPSGANYDKAVRSEAIMVYVFFGKTKISSGSLLIPDSPYFIGLFLCESGSTHIPYTGRYFTAGGRYVCVAHPTLGNSMVSEFDLAPAFEAYFQQRDLPAISGIAISVDTDAIKVKATAQSFVKRIEFLR